jgi:hypothetical protein
MTDGKGEKLRLEGKVEGKENTIKHRSDEFSLSKRKGIYYFPILSK